MHHQSHYLHYAVVVGYFFIALKFWRALRNVRHNQRAKFSLWSMLIIFILCGVTRIFLDFGLNTMLADSMHLTLAIFTWLYVFAGQSEALVAGLQDAADDYLRKSEAYEKS